MDERETDNEDKTEEASEERRRQFREEGHIASPREVVSAVSLACFLSYFLMSGKTLFLACGQMLTRAWTLAGDARPADGQTLMAAVALLVQPLAPHLVTLFSIALLAPLLTGLMLTQFNWSWTRIEFDLSKLNPVTGIGRLFGVSVLIETGKTLVKFAILGAFLYVVLRSVTEGATLNAFLGIPGMSASLGESLMRVMTRVALASAVIGFLDFGFNWFQLQRQMRMTKQEVKDEIKGQEGDPHVKSARRRMARDIVLRRSLAQIPQATFVVTNPEHFAVAIRYVRGMSTPIVVAKGQDFLALKIREMAKKHDIIIVENKALARTLYKLVKVGQEIPPSLYGSVIEVLKYIYQVRGRRYFERFELAKEMGLAQS